MSNQKKECTLEDLDFHMTYHESCSSCDNGECHGTAFTQDKEHFIHVLAIHRSGPFIVTIYDCNDTNTKPTKESFSSDTECATYLRDMFKFKCE